MCLSIKDVLLYDDASVQWKKYSCRDHQAIDSGQQKQHSCDPKNFLLYFVTLPFLGTSTGRCFFPTHPALENQRLV